MDKKVIIIGVGPAGAYLGYLTAKKGLITNIFDKKSKIGLPFQCSGILTEEIENVIPKSFYKTSIDNITRKAMIICGKKVLEVRTKNYVVDRIKFDNLLAEKARDAGANIYMKKEFLRIKNNSLMIKGADNISLRNSVLVGADGPNSRVRRYVDNRHIFLWKAVQARVKADVEKSTIEFYPSICTYAWVVPENESTARIGVLGNNINLIRREFRKLTERKNARLICYIGGVIPKYDPKLRLQKGNIYLLGDAACQVKATTGGGIVPGLKSAKLLSECIERNMDYDALLNKSVGKELRLHLVIRKILDKFDKDDYEKLIEKFNTQGLKRVLETTNRDNMLGAMPRILLHSMKLAYLVKKLI